MPWLPWHVRSAEGLGAAGTCDAAELGTCVEQGTGAGEQASARSGVLGALGTWCHTQLPSSFSLLCVRFVGVEYAIVLPPNGISEELGTSSPKCQGSVMLIIYFQCL